MEPWARQRGESAKAYHAFAHYRDLGATRSIDKAYHEHRALCQQQEQKRVASGSGRRARASSLWSAWATEQGWLDRAMLWDADWDQRKREKVMTAHVEAAERHARLAQGTLTALSTPVRAVLEAVGDPVVLQQLTAAAKQGSAGAMNLLALIARVATAIPALVTVERLAFGMTTESIEVEESRGDLTIGHRIATDPEATQLAIALLDRLAGTGEGSAKGAGSVGRPDFSRGEMSHEHSRRRAG